jgi:hypothetical protein
MAKPKIFSSTRRKTMLPILSYLGPILWIILISFSCKAIRTQPGSVLQQQSAGISCGPNSITWDPSDTNIRLFDSPDFPAGFDRIRLATLKNGPLQLQFVIQDPQVQEGGTKIVGRAPFGARLLSARMDGVAQGKNLLFENRPDSSSALYAKKTHWGRPDAQGIQKFVVLGGVESAFPNQEHGLHASEFWDFEAFCVQDSPSFKATYGRGTSRELAVQTTLNPGFWRQRLHCGSQEYCTRMFYTNVMIPAGKEGSPHRIEVLAPPNFRAVVHSSSRNWGETQSGDILAMEANQNLADQLYGAAPKWNPGFGWETPNSRDGGLGFFLEHQQDPAQKVTDEFGFKNLDLGYQIILRSTAGYYPKFFCDPKETPGVSPDYKLAYCEMWFSPNARNFWSPSFGLANWNQHAVDFYPSGL